MVEFLQRGLSFLLDKMQGETNCLVIENDLRNAYSLKSGLLWKYENKERLKAGL
jgi:hypothetical protein